jgi:integral membrane protein (TIGR01906 family)
MRPLTIFSTVLTWIFTLLLPIMIVFSVARMLMTPVFPPIEYNMPAFPDDPYGFTKDERLKWSKLSIDYLMNNQNISFFDSYKLVDGSPLYNDRELSHMDDVKSLVHKALLIWDLSGFVFLLGVVLSIRSGNYQSLKLGFSRGGYLTIGIIAALLLSVAINFDVLFTQFHALFFKGDSWIFYYSDTFIRLFPIRFWQDCFIYVGVLSLILALAAIKLPGKWIK